MRIKDILKELGMEEQDFDKLYKANRKYSKYSKEINEFNKKYFDDNSTYRLYTPKTIYNRTIKTGETPQFITREVSENIEREAQLYEDFGISNEMYTLLQDIERAYFIHVVIPEFNANEFMEVFISKLTPPSQIDIRMLIKLGGELLETIARYPNTDPEKRMEIRAVRQAFDNFTQFFMQYL